MRNYTSYILATILFFTGIASVQAQSMTVNVTKATGEYELVSYDNSWHVVKGTGVKVTLNGVTVPESSNEKRYENTLTYKKEGQLLQAQDGTDIFEVTQDLTVNFTAIATYQLYKQEEGTGNWIPEGNPQDETVGNITVIFKAYNAPDIDDFTVSSPIKYTYNTANPITFTAEYSYSTEANGLTYAIDWKQNSTSVKTGGDKTYELSTNNIGEFNIEATLSVYAPDKQTIWAGKTANKTVRIFNKPAVNGISPAREYTLVGDDAFNVIVNISKDSDIAADIQWNGGITGIDLTGSFNPNTVGAFPISATVTFKDPDGNNLLNPITSESKTITVYNVPTFTEITPEKTYTVKENPSFSVTANVTKDSGITTSVEWTGGVSGTTEIGSFTPTEVGMKSVSAIVTFKDPDGGILITLPKQNEQPITADIMVYNQPSVQNVTLSRYYALVGDSPFNVELSIDNPDNITYEVNWNEGVDETAEQLKGSFNPNTVGTYPISATVTFKDPDGNNLLSPITSESKRIIVYNVPTFSGITPDKKYTLVGNNPFNVTTNVTKDLGITTSVEWAGGVSGNTETGSFNPIEVGKKSVSAIVTFKDPNGGTLITLPKQNEQPITTDITVFNTPVINGIRLPDDKDFVYSGSKTELYIDVENMDEGVTPVVQWQTSNINKDSENALKATYEAPSNIIRDEDVTLRATVTFRDPDNADLLSQSCSKKITIRLMVLKSNKTITYIDDPDFELDIVGFNESSGGFDYKPKTIWCNEATILDDNELKGKLNSNSISIPEGQDCITINITAKVEVSVRKSGSSDSWTHLSSLDRNLGPVEITVYKKPIIQNIDLASDSEYSRVGKERTFTATVTYEPKSLPVQYELFDKNGTIIETENISNNKTDNGSEIKIKYTPQSENTEGEQINVRVWVYDPTVTERWSEAKNASSPLQIKVYPKPEEVVSSEMLQTNITQNVGENADKPEMLVGYDGQEGQSFTYEVNALNNNYYWVYNWQLIDTNQNIIKEYNNNPKPAFNDLNANTYYVRLIAKAFNKDIYPVDGEGGEYWGKQEVTLPNPITIYSKPVYTPMGNHMNESDNDENPFKYSILTGETFDARKLYSNKDNNGSVTGFPTGWGGKLIVKKDNSTIQDTDKEFTFTPDEKGEYTLILSVTNIAPTGTWLNNKEINNNKDFEYTLYVYDKPQWNIEETTILFDTPIDNKYDRHIVSGEEIPFVIKASDGDTDPAKWTVTMTCDRINNGNPVTFEKESLKFTYNFSETNASIEENTYNFNIKGLNNISYLSKDSKPSDLDILGTIHVWKEITAAVASPSTDLEGNYLLETRVGDSDIQEIKVSLVGGNPLKWTITPVSGTSPVGNENQDGYNYTYTIQDKDFTTEGTFPYSFTVKYEDGATDISALVDLPVSVKVWPEPLITQGLALVNDNKNVTYIEQSGEYNIICYDSDELEMTIGTSGGKTNESWKYQVEAGSKTDIPSNGKINIDGNGTKTIKFYNYLGTKEKEVKTIGTQITRKLNPEIKNVLPTVDNTTAEIWNAAKDEAKRIDLYGDVTKPEFSLVNFDFSPSVGHEGNENGWDYSWKINGAEQSKNNGKWDYAATTSSDAVYEDKTITVNIKNSIPANGSQTGENVGLFETKTYHVRVWHEAELSSADYSLTDNNNSNNDVKTTHGIRKGNKLTAHVDPVKFGYNPGNSGNQYEYVWEGQGAQNQNEWTKIMETGNDEDQIGLIEETYKLTVRNKGPRGTVWAEKSYEPCEVKVYNRPVTPTSLVIKGSGSQTGTSGTLIITYDGINDTGLIERADYAINFFYTDKDGQPTTVSRLPADKSERRWTTTGMYNISQSQMSDAFAYAHWIDEENGVMITSGKRTLSGLDENWDGSIYNLSANEIREIREITRAGSGDWTRINTADYGIMEESDINVYNMNGMKVGNSIKDLPTGMYIIRYQQDGVIKSKKLSVK